MECRHRHCLMWLCLLLILIHLMDSSHAAAQNDNFVWQAKVRSLVNGGHRDAALNIVERQLIQSPNDLEAHGWRGRLLVWDGRFPEAEAEYELVLQQVPQDSEIATSLADLQIRQGKYEAALRTLDREQTVAPTNTEVLTRRARVLFLLDRDSESREQYRAILSYDPTNHSARAALSKRAESNKQSLRIGEEVDFLSYATNTQNQVVSLTSQWNQRWTTLFALNSYQLFGQKAFRLGGGAALRFLKHNWVRIESGISPPQDIIPVRDALVEYGHGLQLTNRVIRGLESTYQQHWIRYRGARVLAFDTNQIVYLPHEWTWAVSITGARTCFLDAKCGLEPSGTTKLTFPITLNLAGNLVFAVGSENFAQLNQIGRVSAHSYGGGIRYHLTASQDVIASLAIQKRQFGQMQTNLGMTYGIRF